MNGLPEAFDVQQLNATYFKKPKNMKQICVQLLQKVFLQSGARGSACFFFLCGNGKLLCYTFEDQEEEVWQRRVAQWISARLPALHE